MKPALLTIVLMLIVLFKMAHDLREARQELKMIYTTNAIEQLSKDYIYVGGERQRLRYKNICK